MCYLDAITGVTWGWCTGSPVGIPRDRREQVFRSSRWEYSEGTGGGVHSQTLRPVPLVWGEPDQWPEVTLQQKAVGAIGQQSGQGVEEEGVVGGPGQHLPRCFSRPQSQVGNKGCSLVSHVLSAATPSFGKNSWLIQPNYSHRANTLLLSAALSLSYCLMLPCLQEAWTPQ